jgi:hypothetical protein
MPHPSSQQQLDQPALTAISPVDGGSWTAPNSTSDGGGEGPSCRHGRRLLAVSVGLKLRVQRSCAGWSCGALTDAYPDSKRCDAFQRAMRGSDWPLIAKNNLAATTIVRRTTRFTDRGRARTYQGCPQTEKLAYTTRLARLRYSLTVSRGMLAVGNASWLQATTRAASSRSRRRAAL